MTRWDDTWPATRMESHYGDRVVRCFSQRPASLHAMLLEAVRRNPDGDALVCGASRISYRALLDQSSRLAAGMAARGIVAGDRVALLLGNRNEFVVSLFAIARLGAIAVPLSIREQAPGLAYMLGHCAAAMVVHEADLADRLPPPRELPSLRTRVAMQACTGSQEYESLLHSPADAPPIAPVHEEDTAAILYTSGTTGRPKGAMLTHLGIVHSSMHFQVGMGLTPADSSMATVPLSHVTGLVALITTAVCSACKLVIMPAFHASEFLELAARERMTHTVMVPAMYNLCLIQPDLARHDLTAWRVGAYGGAPMPVASIEKLAAQIPSLTLMNCYGATETTSPATLMPQGETASHSDTVGIALACADMRVMDDNGRELPPGEQGEIWIGGPMVVKGYWDNPQATAENFTGGYWHSGDVGSIDSQGYVRVLDRKKDMINRGGYKIYCIEVENALYEHPAVQECAVVGKPCPVLGERVHAFVTLKHEASAAELSAFCASRVSDYKVPESFTLSATPLPRNANGKLMKRALREQVGQTAAPR
jgi:long-chain acyl-CoA synthetase